MSKYGTFMQEIHGGVLKLFVYHCSCLRESSIYYFRINSHFVLQ